MKKRYFFLIVSIIAASITLATVYYYQNITRNTIEILIDEKKMINILVAGSNRYRDNRHNLYMIVSINPENSAVGLTFIPPSFKIKTDNRGVGVKKISGVDFSDFNRIRRSLADDLKIDIPFYVEIYSPDVERFINLIGGIDLFILDQVSADDPYFSFGENYLDGRKTVRYINSVVNDSIFLKYDRITDLILTLYSEKERHFDSASAGIIAEMLRSVRTNLILPEVLTLAELVKQGNLLKTVLAPGSMRDELYVVDEISFKIYEKNFFRPLVIGSEPDADIQVKLLNGTRIPGMARKMRNNLVKSGLKVSEFGTFTRAEMTETIIVNRSGNNMTAAILAEFSGIGKIYHITDSRKLNDALIIIGEDAAR